MSFCLLATSHAFLPPFAHAATSHGPFVPAPSFTFSCSALKWSSISVKHSSITWWDPRHQKNRGSWLVMNFMANLSF